MNPFSFVELIKKAIRSSDKSPSYVDKSGSQNLFGSIANLAVPGLFSGAQFIPTDANGGTFDTRDPAQAKWLGLSTHIMQEWAYRFCGPLASVIDRLAEADTNGILELRNSDGSIRTNYRYNTGLSSIMSLFANPNPWQGREDFNAEQLVIAKKHGYCPVFMVRPSGFPRSLTKYMFNLDPTIVVPRINYNFDMNKPDNGGIISKWEFTYFGKFYSIDPENIVVIKDGFTKDRSFETGLPLSKMVGLDYAVSNICAAMEAENVLLRKKGPLGIYTYDPKPDNMTGWKPMSSEAKKELQTDLSNYGLTFGLLQYIISKWPVKWQPTSFNVQELQTNPIARAGIDMICDRYGHPAELMSGKNATYENRTSAERYMYQTVIIPGAIRRMSTYTSYFQLEDVSLYMNYNHLPIMQEDIVKAGEASYYESQALDLDWKNGTITFDEYRQAKDRDPIGGEIGGLYYPEYAKKMGIDLNSPSLVVNTKNNKKNGTSSKDTSTKSKS